MEQYMWGKNAAVNENQINILSAFDSDNFTDDKVTTTPEKVGLQMKGIGKCKLNEVKECWHVRTY